MWANMSVDNPVIKFSPFEALLIGEKNKIAKRKPMKNTIFVTHLNHKRKALDLRDLFDLKEERKGKEKSLPKKKRAKKSELNKTRTTLGCAENGGKPKYKSSRKNQEIYCYEFEGRKVIVKNNEYVKFKTKKKKQQSNRVKFKPDFRFKETLEERIIHKMQKRKKLNGNIIMNSALTQVKQCCNNKQFLRDKNGKFMRREDYDKLLKRESPAVEADYVCRMYANVSSDPCPTCSANGCRENGEFADDVRVAELPKKMVEKCEAVSGDLLKQYYENLKSKKFEFPPLLKLEVIDFDDDANLLDIIYESHPKELRFEVSEDDCSDFSEALKTAEIVYPSKGLKMYERKKSPPNGSNNNNNNENSVCDKAFSNSTKENHCINKRLNVNKMEKLGGNGVVLNGRRKGSKYLIDERPTKGNHLLSRNKMRSLFYKTACGGETYLGNLMKPVLLNSPFGRLPDIS